MLNASSYGSVATLTTVSRPAIAIIGGGVSGVLVAVHLLQNTRMPLDIFLIERRSEWGKGIAYSTPHICHLLNVPVGKISAFADQPDHFLQWLQQNTSPQFAQADAFVPRKLYGQYIQSILDESEQSAAPDTQLIRMTDEVTALQLSESGITITLSSGMTRFVNQVVLALGNLPPSSPAIIDPTFYQSSRYIAWAWTDAKLSQVATDDSVLLIGSGLTAVDLVMTLDQRQHRGQIHLISRRGLLPQVHQPARAYPLALLLEDSQSLRSWLRWLRQEIGTASAEGYDWRSVMDSLRHLTPIIWQGLPLAERRRFLRHLRPYWEKHRHRMAPAIAQKFSNLQATGQLQLHAGRIQSLEDHENQVDVIFRQRHSQDLERLRVQKVINCTNSSDYRTCSDRLINSLLKAGLIRCDALNLGIETDHNGAVLGADGAAAAWLYTLGNTRKGQLWETTAIPEIRRQAAELAQALLANLDRASHSRLLAEMPL